MGNHYHLFVYTQHSNLSKVMQYINHKYSLYFIKKYSEHKKCGHTFCGPYGRRLVQTETYATNLLSYIHLNPYKDGFVEDVKDYFWSSYNAYNSGENNFDLLDTKILANHFQNFNNPQVKINKEILDWDPADYTIDGEILGNKEFAKETYLKQENLTRLERLMNIVDHGEILQFIENLDLQTKSEKKVKAYCLLEWTELNSPDLEEILGIKSGTIRQIRRRVKLEIEHKSSKLSGTIEKVKNKFNLV